MDKDCTIYRVVSFIGKRWTLLILLQLYKSGNSCRYSELKRSLPGITSKILALRLRELQSEGLIRKDVDTSSIPIKSEYFLTESGRDFLKIIDEMKLWALRWKVKNKSCERSDCLHCPIDP
jgi:DNA-binding HxlR family transcriptional regulator